MLLKNKKHSAGVPTQNPRSPSTLDFRAIVDDAWYGVNLVYEDEVLVVKYCNFTEDFDERFRAGDFKDLKELESFGERFRPASIQLQDHECQKVIEGKIACVSHSYGENDFKFYDAIIEMVCNSEHKYIQGEEVCSCTFEVMWQHGPNGGMQTSSSIQHICLLQSGSAQSDPALQSFLEMARKKHELVSRSSCAISNCKSLERKNSKKHGNTKQTFRGKSDIRWEKIGQDSDLGGEFFPAKDVEVKGNCHFILIDNLEKDLFPSTVVDFIFQQTSVLSQAYVSPSLLSESYTRGAILLESPQKFKKLSGFLWNADHLIVSSRGRPWVIAESKCTFSMLGAAFGVVLQKSEYMQKKSETTNEGWSSKLKVVKRGTKEYEKGTKLKELFMEFQEHLQRLHKRLVSEEIKLMQS